MVDVNGDGRADAIGFNNDGVYVALAIESENFGTVTKWISYYCIGIYFLLQYNKDIYIHLRKIYLIRLRLVFAKLIP